MARIRSIKPEFFTSESIAALPLSARLTFIGLWTYADDNGVGIDNELLITAAIWPLERDNLETLARTREDLASLSRACLVSRYRDSRKSYLYITSWDEHQKVDHPRKPRYPRPGELPLTEAITSEDEPVDETLATDSRQTRESVAPEQGSGIRDQGNPPNPPAGGKRVGRQSYDYDSDPVFGHFWSVFPKKKGKPAAYAAWQKALARGADPNVIIKAAERYRDDPARNPDKTKYPQGWLGDERYADETDSASALVPRYSNSPWDNLWPPRLTCSARSCCRSSANWGRCARRATGSMCAAPRTRTASRR
jgi:hypothetical protein